MPQYDNRLDIAKSVFPVHGVDAARPVVVRRHFESGLGPAFYEKLSPVWSGYEACCLVAPTNIVHGCLVTRTPGGAIPCD